MAETLIGFSMGSRKDGKGRVPVTWKYLPTPHPPLVASTVLVASDEVEEHEYCEWATSAAACLACGYPWQAVYPDCTDAARLECPVCHEQASRPRPATTQTFVRRRWREARCRATWRRKWLRRDWR